MVAAVAYEVVVQMAAGGIAAAAIDSAEENGHSIVVVRGSPHSNSGPPATGEHGGSCGIDPAASYASGGQERGSRLAALPGACGCSSCLPQREGSRCFLFLLQIG